MQQKEAKQFLCMQVQNLSSKAIRMVRGKAILAGDNLSSIVTDETDCVTLLNDRLSLPLLLPRTGDHVFEPAISSITLKQHRLSVLTREWILLYL